MGIVVAMTWQHTEQKKKWRYYGCDGVATYGTKKWRYRAAAVLQLTRKKWR